MTVSRGYMLEDEPQLASLGSVSGIASIIVLGLYLSSDPVRSVYRFPDLLWVICLVLLYWISRNWLLTKRGLMSHDPVLFALKDKASWVAGAIVMITWFIARGGF